MTAAEISPTPYQLLPRLTDEEYEALKADIAENGIRVPIDVDENGVVLDGHHRAWIAADLDVACPQRMVSGLDEIGKRNYARAVNALRRHLTREARREQVAQMREEGQSVRMIAGTLGVPKSTVARDLVEVSQTGHLTAADLAQVSGSRHLDEDEPADEPDGFTEKIAAELAASDGDYAGRGHAAVDAGTGEIVEFGNEAPLTEAECEALAAANHPELEPAPETKVTGLDGKQYNAYKPKARPNRKPLNDAAQSAGWELRRAVERIERIVSDPRYGPNAEQVALALRGHLLYAAETVAAVIDQLPSTSGA